MIRKALVAFFEAWAKQIVQALKDWLDERERLQAERDKTTAINDLEDARRDQENAERITRAVDALRTDGAGGLRDPAASAEPDTRGYRD
jgi:hypothetical protein